MYVVYLAGEHEQWQEIITRVCVRPSVTQDDDVITQSEQCEHSVTQGNIWEFGLSHVHRRHWGYGVCVCVIGGPADGKLLPGDQLVKVNDVAVDDLSTEQAVNILKYVWLCVCL